MAPCDRGAEAVMPLFRRGDQPQRSPPEPGATPGHATPRTCPRAPPAPGGGFHPIRSGLRPGPAAARPSPTRPDRDAVARFPVTEGDLPCRARAAPTTTACSATTSTGVAGAARPPGVPITGPRWAGSSTAGGTPARSPPSATSTIPRECPTSTTGPPRWSTGWRAISTPSSPPRWCRAPSQGETFVREPVVSTQRRHGPVAGATSAAGSWWTTPACAWWSRSSSRG
jgi:hypothetical protein